MPRSRIETNGGTSWTITGSNAVLSGTGVAVAPTVLAPWQMTEQASAGTLNAQALVGDNGTYRFGQRPRWEALFGPGASVAVARFWLGLFNTSLGSILASDAPAFSLAAFRFSSAANDRNLQCCVANGTGQTIVDSGVPFVALTPRKFEIFDDGRATYFRINGNDVAVINSANRPAATAGMRQGCGVQTLEAVAKTVQGSYLQTEVE